MRHTTNRLRRKLLAGGAGALAGAGMTMLSRSVLAQTSTIELPIANGRRVVERFPEKRPMIVLTTRPPQLETPFEVFNDSVLTPNDAFFVRYHNNGLPPSIDGDKHVIKIGGNAVAKPYELTMAELRSAFKPVELVAVNQCSGNSRGFFSPRVTGGQSTNGAMGNARWVGVPLKDVLARAEPKNSAREVAFDGLDFAMMGGGDFVKSLQMPHAMDGEVMIAYQMNGADIPFLNGFPVKLIVPGYYGSFLTLMGRMGESTGLPVYGLTVGKAADVQRVGDKDLLLLGGTSNQPLLSQWAGNMPFSASGQIRTFSLSDWILKRMPWYEEPRDDKKPVAKLSAVSLNRDAVLFGFESPLKSGRSVVAIISDKTVGMADVLNALMDSDLVSKIHGSLAIIRGKEVESMALGNTYYVGSLPPLIALRWFLSGTPWLIAALLLVAAAILGTVMYAFLRRKANKRITGK